MDYRCDPEKIRAVHTYLKQHFPGYTLYDFHAPTRLMQAGLPMPHDEHHVVRLTCDGILPYYTVLLNDFQEHSVQEIEERLQEWNLAETVRAHRVGIASKRGASAL
jgi:hypothetical protein